MNYQHQYLDGTRIHFPLGKVVCVGRNYAEHAKELNNPVPTEPLLFIKPGSCVVPLDESFSIPAERGAVHYCRADRQAVVEEAECRRSHGCYLRLCSSAGSDPA